MSHSNVNSQVNVPFSWEHKPGVSKLTHNQQGTTTATTRLDLLHFALITTSLPPPPCPSSKTTIAKYDEKEPDPFLVAYKKCTDQYPVPVNGTSEGTRNIRTSRRKRVSINGAARNLSCKCDCGVASDNFVTMSHIPRHHQGRGEPTNT